MIVAIDSGNSLIKIGFFDKGKLVKITENKTFESIVQEVKTAKPEAILISSVYLKKEIFSETFKDYSLFFLNESTSLPFSTSYNTLSTLGSDRLAAVAGGIDNYSNSNILIVQTGTCFTYDFVDSFKLYHGGGISPGIDMRFKSLESFTKNLPLVNFKEDPSLIGKSTKESIQSGVINGAIAEIQGIIDRYIKKYDQIKVILTGGYVKFFESKLKGSIFAIPNLVLWGLYNIYQFNEGKEKGL